jgi:hypothetical protein
MSNTGSGMSAGSTAVTLTDSPIVNNTATLACRSVRRHGPRGASSDEHGNPYWRPHIASP